MLSDVDVGTSKDNDGFGAYGLKERVRWKKLTKWPKSCLFFFRLFLLLRWGTGDVLEGDRGGARRFILRECVHRRITTPFLYLFPLPWRADFFPVVSARLSNTLAVAFSLSLLRFCPRFCVGRLGRTFLGDIHAPANAFPLFLLTPFLLCRDRSLLNIRIGLYDGWNIVRRFFAVFFPLFLPRLGFIDHFFLAIISAAFLLFMLFQSRIVVRDKFDFGH
ncbi:hypothetical protein B0H13DRAFT_2536445, partial [Mycena leptocephala]